MNIIKLDAINSTNDHLKAMLQQQFVSNFTVIVAENQIKGRGQMGAKWNVESGKSLTFSVLVKDLLVQINDIFHLNVAVALSVVEALSFFEIKNLAIKWPNDILAEGKKIGGILIENSIKSNGEIFSIVGIGLNINQKKFTNLPKATSLYNLTNTEFDKDLILTGILKQLKINCAKIINNDSNAIWDTYHHFLFKKGIPMPFEDSDGKKFMGIIQNVNNFGMLNLLLEDDTVQMFDIKQIKMLY